jgi:hypothetical protein
LQISAPLHYGAAQKQMVIITPPKVLKQLDKKNGKKNRWSAQHDTLQRWNQQMFH